MNKNIYICHSSVWDINFRLCVCRAETDARSARRRYVSHTMMCCGVPMSIGLVFQLVSNTQTQTHSSPIFIYSSRIRNVASLPLECTNRKVKNKNIQKKKPKCHWMRSIARATNRKITKTWKTIKKIYIFFFFNFYFSIAFIRHLRILQRHQWPVSNE